MVMSSMTRKVVIIVVRATMARWTPGVIRPRGGLRHGPHPPTLGPPRPGRTRAGPRRSAGRSPQFDDGDDRHAGHEERVAVLPRLEHELHGDALDDLHEVPGGVLGRQEREARAGAALDRVHPRTQGEPGCVSTAI